MVKYRLTEEEMIINCVLGYGSKADGETAELRIPLTACTDIWNTFYGRVEDVSEAPPDHEDGSIRKIITMKGDQTPPEVETAFFGKRSYILGKDNWTFNVPARSIIGPMPEVGKVYKIENRKHVYGGEFVVTMTFIKEWTL
jgi:hypothetical protein